MIKELGLDENIDWYTEKFNKALYKTVYNNPEFLYAEEAAEKYPTYLYLYEVEDDYVIFPSIKRKINDLPWANQLGKEVYDLVTPHEYSGVIASKWDSFLVSEFYREFYDFCRKSNIIYGFVRFNPYTKEQEYASKHEIRKSAVQTWIDLQKDDIFETFSQSCRRNIKHAIKDGITCHEVEKNASNIDTFVTMYKQAMDDLKAVSFFYFSQDYFLRLMRFSSAKLYFVYNQNCPVAASIVLVDEYNRRGYYHLSCRDRRDSHSGIMETLIYHFSLDLKEIGCTGVHLGGGATESLREFKQRFSKEGVDYYLGFMVSNMEEYESVCHSFLRHYPSEEGNSFKPLYRCNE